MKKLWISLTAIVTGFGLLSTTVQAETYPQTPTDWQVTFTGSELQSNFTTAAIQESLQGMQPGDDANFVIKLNNKYGDAVDWYMENEVINSFEDTDVARGGAYTYELVYYPASGPARTLYTSNTVGGEDTSGGLGLYEATTALDDYIYLERIGSGQSSRLELHVLLDGETQINAYQDTKAKLEMDFAVEIPEKVPGKPGQGTGRRKIYVPNTGDTRKAAPYIISGLLSLVLFAWCAYRLRQSAKAE